VERFAFDARWKYAAGGLDFDYPGFVHTVLVDMRARLARSDRPTRIFEVTLQATKAARLVGRRRVLDSTPLYDAVATMDTVTLIRSAIRGLLRVADGELQAKLRARLSRTMTTRRRENRCVTTTIRQRARRWWTRWPATALLACLDGQTLGSGLGKAAELLATVVGQHLDQDAGDEMFRIARRVAADRVISTVDPDARHGHKTSARGFDGYKGHIAIDPDAEIITATEVTAGNAGDAEPATDLLTDDRPTPATGDTNVADGDCGDSQDDSNLGAGAGTGTVNLSNPRAIFAGSPPRFTRSRVTYEAYVVSRTSTRPQVDSAHRHHPGPTAATRLPRRAVRHRPHRHIHRPRHHQPGPPAPPHR
jgi:Transposase DDE domain